VVAAAEPLAEHKGSRIDVVVPVLAGRRRRRGAAVERVLRNLVVNAVEHGEGRPVEVRLTATPDAVVVTVRDRGVGLQPGQAGMVFTRFWRGDPSGRAPPAAPAWAGHRAGGRPAARRLAAGGGRAGLRLGVPDDPAAAGRRSVPNTPLELRRGSS
jgi:signal transduction histidine kinase